MAIATAAQQNWPNASGNIQYKALKELLWRPDAYEYMTVAAEEKTFEAGNGYAVNLRRMITTNISAIPEPEGQNPATQAQAFEDFPGVVQRYSEAYAATSYEAALNPWPTVKEMVKTVKIKMGNTRERIRYNAARSGTNIIYNSTAVTARNQVNGAITLGRLQLAVRGIRASKGRAFNEGGSGSTKIGTTPVESGFYCFSHTDTEADIRSLPGFVPLAQMTGGPYPNGTFGSVQNIIFITNPEYDPYLGAGAASGTMLSTGGNTNVYTYIIMAKGALASVKVTGAGVGGMGNAEVMVLDEPDKSDYTNARVIVAAAWYDLAILTSNDWCVVVETGVTANPA